MTILGLGNAWVLSIIGGFIGSFLPPAIATYSCWIGWCLGAFILIVLLCAYVPYERRQRCLASADTEADSITDIQVTNARAYELGPVGNLSPIFAIDIGDEQILYLAGQWLYDPSTYGAPDLAIDEQERSANGLPAPYSFPTDDFTITRFPVSGEVVAIATNGNYIAPIQTVDAMKTDFQFQPSEIFHGSLDRVAEVLEAEHQRRCHQAYSN